MSSFYPISLRIPLHATGFSKAHLDNIIAQSKLEISPTSKPWEPYRAYEKKLSAALMKEKGVCLLRLLG